MKFGKEFSAQMVPEWQEAYMNYNFLKTTLKEIQRFQLRNRSHAIESHPILVSSVSRDDSESYQTTFLMAAEEGGEYELVYFRRLDDEFNKVGKFYMSKVEEVMKEAEMLNKQVDALIAFRIKVENPVGWSDRAANMTLLAYDVTASSAALAAPSRAKASRRMAHLIDVVNEESGMHVAEPDRQKEAKESDDTEQHARVELKLPKDKVFSRPAPLEILNHVKISKTLETPRSIIKKILKVPHKTELKFTRENLKNAEDQLKCAFIEFYQELCLLKSFAFLNTVAFSKIMKKYDKITSRNASKAYMNMVDNSFLGSSSEVQKLIERVETTFIKHFANSNITKGMRVLRPKGKRKRHRTTFSIGFLSGCTVALTVALILIVRAQKIMDKPGRQRYMSTMFPLYSLFGFVALHMIMFAGNIYFWRRYRVNYSFIFGCKPGAELGYREVLLLSFGVAVLALGCVLLNLDMEMNPKTKDYEAFTELLPLNLVIFLLIILFMPFNVLYRHVRYFFLTCMFRCIAAPFYKVTLPDFFLADQLTSQVQAIRSLEFYVCYYGWGDFKHRQHTCKSSDVYNTFYFIVAVIPYWSRLLQCLRRLFEEKDPMQVYYGIKNLLTVVAVVLTTTYSLNKRVSWRVIAWIFSAIAAIVGTYMDIAFDWGLLQKNSKNRWLRDKLLISQKKVYYVAIVFNVLLRFPWFQTVLNFTFTFLHKETMIALVASLEIIRRGIWNFFRLENEHLNNVGKYRAFKSVPLPFDYDEDDDKDD